MTRIQWDRGKAWNQAPGHSSASATPLRSHPHKLRSGEALPPATAVYQPSLEQLQGQETISDISFYTDVYFSPVVSSFSSMAVLKESEILSFSK